MSLLSVVRSTLFSLFLLSALSASAITPVTGGGEGEMSGEVNKMRPYDVRFIDELSRHHKDGIMMSEMAVEKAFHPELKQMAKEMVAAQMAELEMLQGWRAKWYPNVKAWEYKGMEMDMSRLESTSGNEFDLAFLDSMIMHHPGAIFLGAEASRRGTHRELRKLGAKIARDQIREVNMMRDWRDMWSK